MCNRLISPAIFGALFQCVIDEEDTARRRNLGAHYTSEENILKLIKPLFLDDLPAEYHAIKRNSNKLYELLKKIARLKFFDPACGCGNFLVIAYRELRLLELEILRAARATGQMHLDIFQLVQMELVSGKIKGAGVLDYVTALYLKAAHYIQGNDNISMLLDNMPGAQKPPRDKVKYDSSTSTMPDNRSLPGRTIALRSLCNIIIHVVR